MPRTSRCSVAFPLIYSGAYGYPKDLTLKVVIDLIGDINYKPTAIACMKNFMET